MVGIHRTDLTSIVPSPVCVLVIHVVGDPDLRKYHRMVSHVTQTLLSEEFQLIAQAISDGRFADF